MFERFTIITNLINKVSYFIEYWYGVRVRVRKRIETPNTEYGSFRKMKYGYGYGLIYMPKYGRNTGKK